MRIAPLPISHKSPKVAPTMVARVTEDGALTHPDRMLTGAYHHPVLQARRRVATGQVASRVVRISVPARTALVTGVLSATSASFARCSWSTPCRVISRSIHLVFWSLTM